MRLVFFGDSITDGKRDRENDFINTSYGNGYVRDIVADLFSIDPNGYEVIKRGISGNRIVDLYARVKSDVWNFNPDVLSILIGVNDIWHEIGDFNGVDIERFEKMYRILLEDTKKRLPNLKIMLLEPFFLVGSATKEHIEEFSKAKEYAKVVKKLANEFDCAFVPLQDKFDEAAKKFGAEYYLYDGVHPDSAGAKLIANEWLKSFNKDIK
jgi:lysophospholipase L1-like esterase